MYVDTGLADVIKNTAKNGHEIMVFALNINNIIGGTVALQQIIPTVRYKIHQTIFFLVTTSISEITMLFMQLLIKFESHLSIIYIYIFLWLVHCINYFENYAIIVTIIHYNGKTYEILSF